MDQVGVGWVCTILNEAGVPWLFKYALHKGTWYVGGIDTNPEVKEVFATCEEKILYVMFAFMSLASVLETDA